MTDYSNRKPIGNFFIKKSLQIRLIVKIVIAVMVATLINSGTLLLVYYIKYKSVLIYQMDSMTNLTRENIIFIILPSLTISIVVNFIMAIGIGLYASRKYAVPVYKLEKWAQLLIKGKITAKLKFREKEEMKELSDYCNELSSELCNKLMNLKKYMEINKDKDKEIEALRNIRAILATLDLDSDTIEVHTTHFKLANKTQPYATDSSGSTVERP
ncbi:MAG TPA: hypothetical protein DCO75_03500 [Fibrobacteres bacterium]|jgi:signal transduction histidine kinase|nr:hypothetical protein [Fibrobacterota bacterium]